MGCEYSDADLERVARALFQNHCPGGDPETPFEGGFVWQQFEDEARIAVRAFLKLKL